jgi:transporter family protein
MQRWVVDGIITAICWGSYIVLMKLGGEDSAGEMKFIWMVPGVLIAALMAWIFGHRTMPGAPSSLIYICAGAIWGLGMLFAVKAIEHGADVSKLAPLYNTNVLVSLLLGIIILREPLSFKTVVGAILVIAGGVLVSGK